EPAATETALDGDAAADTEDVQKNETSEPELAETAAAEDAGGEVSLERGGLPKNARGAKTNVLKAAGNVTTEAELFDALNAIPEGGSGTIRLGADITVTKSIRYWTKHVTIESDMSAFGAPFTIKRGAGWPLTNDTVRPWAAGGYYASLIEVGVSPADGTKTSSVTLQNIIIDDNNNPDNLDYEGIISAYAAGITVNLNAGSVLKNYAPSNANSNARGVVFLDGGARCVMDKGAKITAWKGGMGSASSALHLSQSSAEISGDFKNETIAGNAAVAYVNGGTLSVKPSSEISGNNFGSGALILMRHTTDSAGKLLPPEVELEGTISGNTAGSVVDAKYATAPALISKGVITGNTVSKIVDADSSKAPVITVSGAITKNNISLHVINVVATTETSRVTIGPSGSIEDNKISTINLTGATSMIYAANTYGPNIVDVFGKINNNTSPNRGTVLFQQKGEFNIYAGAQINGNVGGTRGGIIEMNGSGGTENGVLTMHGGEIRNNKNNTSVLFTDTLYKDSRDGGSLPGAGTIHLTKGAHMIMRGGVISGNTALIGGAVVVGALKDDTKGLAPPALIIQGGTITGNTAASLSNPKKYQNVYGGDIAICAPADALWPNNTKTLPTGSGTYTGSYGNNYVEIGPAATVGDVGIQNGLNPAFGSFNYAWNQQVVIPASRTETIAVGALPQYAGTAVLDALKDGIENTATGYAKNLTKYDTERLMYDGNVWIATDKASGTQKVSLSYPTGYSTGAHKVNKSYTALAPADRDAYEYVFIYQPVDGSGAPVGNATAVRPSRGAGSLDFDMDITSGAHAYAVVKYYYPKTSEMELIITHSHPGVSLCGLPAADAGCKGAFVEKRSGSAAPLTFTYDITSGAISVSNDVITTPVEIADGKITLKATPKTGYNVASVTLTAGDGTVKAMQTDANGEVELSYSDLSAPASAGAKNTVHAVFEPLKYTVTFKDWNGNVLKKQTVGYGESAAVPNDPARKGYTFAGWDKPSSAWQNVTADVTVTAAYRINEFTVTFNDYDGKALKTQTVEYGGNATAPADPARTGYRFAGWDKASSAWQNVTADVTITAAYKINTFTVTFNDYDGKMLKTQTVEYGGNATAPADPART
ncbi:MAG: InlB B-repeat-containing protein, partial [Clostridiales Family XIII bacterium]|nr:InlB B-repeat-containing protein [Clostridiales Family XIII bacterium]